MNILDKLENEGIYRVTELNTRKRVHKSEIEDILYGEEYKKYEFKTQEEAEAKKADLKKQGISSRIAKIIQM